MQVAVTADVHLRTQQEYPERYSALDNILAQLASQDIDVLLVAGDLFDADLADYSEFEQLCGQYPSVQLHIIPGNHDAQINEAKVVGPNIHIYTEPEILVVDSTTFLMMPYDPNATMGRNSRMLLPTLRSGNGFWSATGITWSLPKHLILPCPSTDLFPGLTWTDTRRRLCF